MRAKSIISQYAVVFILVALIIFFGIISNNFLTGSNMYTILRQSCMTAVLTAGVAMLLITGNIDLSIGAQISFISMIITVLITQYAVHPFLAVVIGLLFTTGVGLLNGFIVTKFKIVSLIVTLATQQILQGVSYLLNDGLPIYGVDQLEGVSAGVTPIIIMVAVLVACALLLGKTYYGRYLYAIGSNAEAAKLSGVNVNKISLINFSVGGFLAGLTGVMMVGRVASGQPAAGTGYDMDCITAAVLGGVSVLGGKGNMLGALIGVLIISVMTNGLTLAGMNEYVQLVVKGVILMLAVIFDSIQSNNMFAKKPAVVKSSDAAKESQAA